MLNAESHEALSLVSKLVAAMAEQREALASSDWAALSAAVPQLQTVVWSISQFPGGVEGLRNELSNMSDDRRETLKATLQAAAVDRRTSAELIKINLQRFSALRSIYALSEADDVYGQHAASTRPGLKLSTRV